MISKDTYNFSIDISLWEFVRINFYILLRIKAFQTLLLLYGCLAAFMILSPLYPMIKAHHLELGSLWDSVSLYLSIVIGFFLVILLGTLYIGKYQPKYRQGLHYQFNHWGMEMIGGMKDLSIPWRQIQKMKETKTLFVLYILYNNIVSPHPIFKKNIGTPQQADEFKAFVQQNLAAAR